MPVLTLNKFGGLSSSTTSAQLDPGECPVFTNLRLFGTPHAKVIQRRGIAAVTSFGPDTNQDLQLLSWQKLAQEYLVAVVTGSVVDAYTGAVLAGGANRFPGGNEVNACWLDFKILLGDGVHPNVALTVSGGVLTASQLTVDPADASGMGVAAGVAGTLTGTYTYAVKFLSALGVESDLKAYSPAVTVTAQKIALTSIPLAPAGQDCAGRNLYRTKVGSASYFLVTTLRDNVTTAYTDNTGDAQLGSLMQNQGYQNSPFPPCRYLLAHQSRLYGAGCFATTGAVTGSVNVLYASDVLDPTTARIATDPTTTYQGGRFPLETPGAGQLTGLGSYGSFVVAFTGGSMFLFSGSQPSNFALSNFSTHGCSSHRSILSAQEALLWLAPDGVYAWKAQGYLEYTLTQRSYLRVSDKVRDRIDAMTATDMSQASAVFSDNRYWLSWPNGNLVYDFLTDGWYEDSSTVGNWRQLTASVFTSGNRQRLYASRSGHSQVYQLDTGTTDAGSPILCHLQTKDLNADLPSHNKRLAWVGGLFRTAAAETLSGSLIRNAGETIHTWVIPLVSGSVWQVVPGNAAVVRMRQRPPDSALSEFHRLDFQCSSTTGLFELLEANLEYVQQGDGIDAGGCNG